MAAHEDKETIIVVETRNDLKGFDEEMKRDCKDFEEEIKEDLKKTKFQSSIELAGSTDQLKNTEEQSNETGQM